jgi:hypothetical protein
MSQALPAGAALDRTPLVRVQRVPKAAFRDCQKQHPLHSDVQLLRNRNEPQAGNSQDNSDDEPLDVMDDVDDVNNEGSEEE